MAVATILTLSPEGRVIARKPAWPWPRPSSLHPNQVFMPIPYFNFPIGTLIVPTPSLCKTADFSKKFLEYVTKHTSTGGAIPLRVIAAYFQEPLAICLSMARDLESLDLLILQRRTGGTFNYSVRVFQADAAPLYTYHQGLLDGLELLHAKLPTEYQLMAEQMMLEVLTNEGEPA
jgi:hypothetical protein